MVDIPERTQVEYGPGYDCDCPEAVIRFIQGTLKRSLTKAEEVAASRCRLHNRSVAEVKREISRKTAGRNVAVAKFRSS